MCDVKKYEKLQPEDTLQLVLEAETEEQKEFYEMVGAGKSTLYETLIVNFTTVIL